MIEHWGKEAYESSDRWWRSLTEAGKQNLQQTHLDIATDYGRAHQAGLAPDNAQVQAIVQRHFDWITVGWQGKRPDACSFRST